MMFKIESKSSMGKRIILICCLILSCFFCFNQSYSNINTDKTIKYDELKDSSFLKRIILKTITNYIDSLNNIVYGNNPHNEVYVVRIDETDPSKNQCNFSLSLIMNRSELYDVKPTHYFLINNKVVLIKCQNYLISKKVGLDTITIEAKEEALKSFCGDSWDYRHMSYPHIYYFFYYNNDKLIAKLTKEPSYDFLDWLNDD